MYRQVTTGRRAKWSRAATHKAKEQTTTTTKTHKAKGANNNKNDKNTQSKRSKQQQQQQRQKHTKEKEQTTTTTKTHKGKETNNNNDKNTQSKRNKQQQQRQKHTKQKEQTTTTTTTKNTQSKRNKQQRQKHTKQKEQTTPTPTTKSHKGKEKTMRVLTGDHWPACQVGQSCCPHGWLREGRGSGQKLSCSHCWRPSLSASMQRTVRDLVPPPHVALHGSQEDIFHLPQVRQSQVWSVFGLKDWWDGLLCGEVLTSSGSE